MDYKGFLLEKSMKFTNDQHKLWTELMKRQIPNVEKFACKEYLEGLKILSPNKNAIPTMESLNQKITPRTGWKAMRTKIRYLDSVSWYKHVRNKEFVTTEFLRSWDEFEFTHEPDMFHDIFGHQPFHTLPKYTELIEMFAPAYFKANQKQKEDIKRLAWFSYEFGLIKQNGQPKIFGAGLISSIGEIGQVVSGKTPILPFTINNVTKRNKAIYTFNKELFIFNSLEDLKAELQKFFNSIGSRNIILPKKFDKITDQQMTGIK